MVSYCGLGWNKHECTNDSLICWLQSFYLNSQEWDDWSCSGSILRYLNNLHAVFHNDYTSSPSHRVEWGGFSNIVANIECFDLGVAVIRARVRWNLFVVLIHIFKMTSYQKSFFMFWLSFMPHPLKTACSCPLLIS